jgi:hypothetical protein
VRYNYVVIGSAKPGTENGLADEAQKKLSCLKDINNENGNCIICRNARKLSTLVQVSEIIIQQENKHVIILMLLRVFSCSETTEHSEKPSKMLLYRELIRI